MIWQHEVGEQGTQHTQGYIEFTTPRRFTQVQAVLGGFKAHCEKRMGTAQQAIDYCKKEESRLAGPFELGIAGGSQGKRTDLSDAWAIARDEGLFALLEADPPTFIKYHGGLCKAKQVYDDQREYADRKVKVYVLWGPTGTGKSYRATHRHGKANTFIMGKYQKDNLFFNAYHGQTTLVLDEFRGEGQIYIEDLNRILDEYEYTCNVKYGHTRAAWTTVYICSNRPPTDWYVSVTQALQDALMRRLNTGGIFEITSKDQVIDWDDDFMLASLVGVEPEREDMDVDPTAASTSAAPIPDPYAGIPADEELSGDISPYLDSLPPYQVVDWMRVE